MREAIHVPRQLMAKSSTVMLSDIIDPEYIAQNIRDIVSDTSINWQQFFNISITEDTHSNRPVMEFWVLPPEDSHTACSFVGLSCYDQEKHRITLNLGRYLLGSKNSGLSLDNYRKYLCLHEQGHALGFGHLDSQYFAGEPVPIMVQATIGIGNCNPNCAVSMNDALWAPIIMAAPKNIVGYWYSKYQPDRLKINSKAA
jgi:hypothetical protein